MIGEYPSVGDVVDAVHAADVETAILSNTDEAHWALQLTDESGAERFPTVRRIGHRFGSHLLGVVKPERAVFDTVMEATGFKERRILYFDDSKRHVDASVDAGWGGVLVDPSGDPARQMLFELNRRMVTLGQKGGGVGARYLRCRVSSEAVRRPSCHPRSPVAIEVLGVQVADLGLLRSQQGPPQEMSASIVRSAERTSNSSTPISGS